ncbi:MAG: Na/Pi cotransporter family protein [Lachnospiraceae bacterium]|nr:Na/Pi cotransporter family protein [Lachnospiraceae bacterium]
MDFFGILKMVGGLALFLYGMDLMGEGLAKASGGKLEKILERLTSNPIKAVLLGAGVTAVIQSSSATTVIVVGFVNSGIMKLEQAVGLIMGANIGTTVTSWLLSLAGIESGNFFINLLKPSSFSPILAIIGVVFLQFLKSDKKKNIGMIMVGFAILMTGMDTMSAAVKPLANVPEFTNILLMFSNPVLGLLAGAILTAIIQSSSASVGILQALCMTGAVTYGTALPIIMGQNIGTCVTAMISGIGASKNARRTALIHLYFNIIGTTIFLVIFYTINAFVDFAFLDTAANAAGIAVIHSVFNITATIVLLPFSKVLVKLACLTIRDDKVEEELPDNAGRVVSILEPRFLEMPAYATEVCMEASEKMAYLSVKAVVKAMDLLKKYDETEAQKVIDLEEEVDSYEDELGAYMVQLSRKDLAVQESQTLSMMLHSLGDFERLSDHAVTIRNAAEEMSKKGMKFSEHAQQELDEYMIQVRKIMDATISSFKNRDLVAAGSIFPMEEVAEKQSADAKKNHIRRLREGKCTIELGFVQSDLLTSMESIVDHCSNVAETVISYR